MSILERLKVSVRGFGRPGRRRGGANRLLFVFGGASHNWRGPGAELYREEPVLRATVDGGDSMVRASLGFSSSAMFRDDWHPDRDDDRRRADIVSMGLLHLGLADLWAAAGIRPDGVIGISLGEIGAAYVCGAIDKKGAISTMCAIAASVGNGIHRCSGIALARSVVPAALGILLDRSPRLRACEPLDSIPMFASVTVHTPERLIVGS